VKLLDLFSGIGGFHQGFTQAGYTFDWVGFSEIDKYASAVYKYNYKESEELGDITTIRPGRDTPDNIDILCAGFPCQAFSVAGRRKGFDDSRGTLFFEIARILKYYRKQQRPIKCLVLENVKGLLSHDSGRTFAVIYRILSDLGYTIEFQLLNTRWWLPQNRERIYIVGYIGNRGGPQVFPIGEDGKQLNKNRLKGRRVVNGLDSHYYKGADGKRTMIQIGTIGKDSEATKNVKKVGNIYQSGGENGNIYDISGVAPTLKSGTTSNKKHGGIGSSNSPKISVSEATKKGYAEATVGDAINLERPTSKTRRGRVTKGYAQSLETVQHQHTVDGGIRRLTPVECNRLQGFSDDHNKYGVIDAKVVEMSDTQRYKQAGNAVTVDVVEAVARIIKQKELI